MEVIPIKSKLKPFLTPKGKLMWVNINGKEDMYQGKGTGKYSATLELDESSYEELKGKLKEMWETTEEFEKVKEVVEVMNPSIGLKKKKDKDGNIHYLIKAKTNVETKDGKQRLVTVKDGSLDIMPTDVFIRNGSEGRLMIYPAARYLSDSNYGLTMYLMEIQVTSMAEYNGLEFPKEEEDNELPF